MTPMRRFAAMLSVLSTTACTVGPNFVAPRPVVPETYVTPVGKDLREAPVVTMQTPDEAWWRQFKDPTLDRLEDRTRDGNLDLQAGLMRVVESRAQVQAARAQGLPSLNAVASYNREQLGVAGILKAQGDRFGAGALDPTVLTGLTSPISIFQIGFDASWELDLFGKVRRTVEAAKAESESALESRNDMLITLEAEVAQTYLQLRAAQLLRSITEALTGDERLVLDLTLDRQRHGLAQQSDVETARAQLAMLQSQLPEYMQNIAVARHSLAVLSGQAPEALDAELDATADLPLLPATIPIGMPSSLARRRPDIRQAEASLHAATADVGVSLASFYPDVSLTGTAGLRNTSARYLFDWASKFYTAGPSISLPVFRGGALVASVTMARAGAAEAALSYRQTVLNALKEVEDCLASLDQDGIRVAALTESVAADQRSVDISTHAYDVGLTTYIGVLNAGLQSNQARQQLAQASLIQLTDLVKLYKALGGGWDAVAPVAVN